MKLNTICIKFDQKIKNLKNLNLGLLEVFKGFLTPKTLGFFEAISQPWCSCTKTTTKRNLIGWN